MGKYEVEIHYHTGDNKSLTWEKPYKITITLKKQNADESRKI